MTYIICYFLLKSDGIEEWVSNNNHDSEKHPENQMWKAKHSIFTNNINLTPNTDNQHKIKLTQIIKINKSSRAIFFC